MEAFVPEERVPTLDSHRYSLINLEESLEHDLDAILGELSVLESSFDQGLIHAPPPPPSAAHPVDFDPSVGGDLPPPPAPLQLEELMLAAAELPNSSSNSSSDGGADSAFCENASSSSSTEEFSNPLPPPPPPQMTTSHFQKRVSAALGLDPASAMAAGALEDAAARDKAEKIKLAIKKIREASYKKMFVKVFAEDGSTKSLLVDERMTVAQVCGTLADKNHVRRDSRWALVELLPDLHLERTYEDHELLVDSLLAWKRDSKNTLWFIKRPEAYDLFRRPELYLLNDKSSSAYHHLGHCLDEGDRAQLVREYFASGSSAVGAPSLRGALWLKAAGKKNWKRFQFVVHSAGVYYSPKSSGGSGKSLKDLVCLARFDSNEVYHGVKWGSKFRAPTEHCFAVKPPSVQSRDPRFTRYLCADTALEMDRWVTCFRLARHGARIYHNYSDIVRACGDGGDNKKENDFSLAAGNGNFGVGDGTVRNNPPTTTPPPPPTPPSKPQNRDSSLLTFRPPSKHVRFDDDDDDDSSSLPPPAFREHAFATMRRAPKKASSGRQQVEVAPSWPFALATTGDAQAGRILPLRRRYSTESLLLAQPQQHQQQQQQHLQPEPQQRPLCLVGPLPPPSPPQRPAPILKPQILGRKPSLDLGMLRRGHQEKQLQQQQQQQQQHPTYEDTLKKCQSLTRRRPSAPAAAVVTPALPPKPTGPPLQSATLQRGGGRRSAIASGGSRRSQVVRSSSLNRVGT